MFIKNYSTTLPTPDDNKEYKPVQEVIIKSPDDLCQLYGILTSGLDQDIPQVVTVFKPKDNNHA